MTLTPLCAALGFWLLTITLSSYGIRKRTPIVALGAKRQNCLLTKRLSRMTLLRLPTTLFRSHTIKVKVNLVNVLVSVLDDNNRPAADLPRSKPFNYREG